MTNRGGDTPWWVSLAKTFGIGGVIAVYLLGMIPGLASPMAALQTGISVLQGGIDTLSKQLALHDANMRAALRTSRQSCRGIWRGFPDEQERCGANE